MLFGRAHEELSELRTHGIAVEVVPGVTAALAASAEIGVSLTRRGLSRSVVFATPRAAVGEQPSGWVEAAAAADTAAIYMGVGDAPAIAQALLGAGKPASTPVAVVEHASLAQAHAVYGTLGELPRLAAEMRGGPALILLGAVLSETVNAARQATPRKAQAG
jgi:siroheme synthase